MQLQHSMLVVGATCTAPTSMIDFAVKNTKFEQLLDAVI